MRGPIYIIDNSSNGDGADLGPLTARVNAMDTYNVGRVTTTFGTTEMDSAQPLSAYVAVGTTLTLAVPEYDVAFTIDFYSLGAGAYVGENFGVNVDDMAAFAFAEIRNHTTGFLQFHSAAGLYAARVLTQVGISHAIGGTAAPGFGLPVGAFGPTVEVVNLAGRITEVDAQFESVKGNVSYLGEQALSLEGGIATVAEIVGNDSHLENPAYILGTLEPVYPVAGDEIGIDGVTVLTFPVDIPTFASASEYGNWLRDYLIANPTPPFLNAFALLGSGNLRVNFAGEGPYTITQGAQFLRVEDGTVSSAYAEAVEGTGILQRLAEADDRYITQANEVAALTAVIGVPASEGVPATGLFAIIEAQDARIAALEAAP